MEKNNYDVSINKPTPIYAKILSGIFLSILILITGLTVAFNIIYDYHPVRGTSMYPTLNSEGIDEDGVYVNTYNKGDYDDIVIASSLVSEKIIVKRLLAKGGDKLKVESYIKNSKQYFRLLRLKQNETQPEIVDYSDINGGITISFFNNFYSTTHNGEPANKTFENNWLLIPSGYVFLAGDNMSSGNSSEDCVDYGPIEEKYLYGKVDFIVYHGVYRLKQVLQQIGNIFK